MNLRDNVITDLEPLQHLTHLTYLNIHSNPIENGLISLGKLTELKTLIMRNVKIGDEYAFLENLIQLNRLNIRNSYITDVSVLGKLMEAGALQDNPETGRVATIDLFQINPTDYAGDPYRLLRPYWDNISNRYPLSLPYYPSAVHSPQFSLQSGFFKTSFHLTLSTEESGAKIFYTLNGSEPALTPQLMPLYGTYEYQRPIYIERKTINNQSLAHIKTSVMDDYPDKDVSEIFIANVVRAIVVKPDGSRSNVETHTFFIDEKMNEIFSLPIISIAINPEHFFDSEFGIYVPGDLYEDVDSDQPWWNPANYTQRGLKWERPIAFEMFTHQGESVIKQNLGIRIHGGATRWFPQKSLRLYAKPEYDHQTLIQYNFFPDLNGRINDNYVDTFKTLIIRNSGNDWMYNGRWLSTMFRDAMSQSLLEHTCLDIQGVYPVNVFINGEYWGIQNVRTRYDEHYFSSYYGIELSELTVLEGGFGKLILGSQEGEEAFHNMYQLIDESYMENSFQTSTALKDQKLYEELSAVVDIENFITYNVSQTYFNNTDWGGSNVRFWRRNVNSTPSASRSLPYGHDGKWRFMIIDTDFGFFDPQNNTLYYATRDLSSTSFLLRSFLENNQFRIQFINTFADHLNTSFREEVVIDQINKFESIYLPDASHQIARWGNMGGSIDAWLENVQSMKDFASMRPSLQRQHIIEFFDLPGTFEINLQIDPNQGYIKINTIEITTGSVGVDDPKNWSGFYFQGIPVEITAIPNDGFRFLLWEGLEGLDVDVNSSKVTINSGQDLFIKAIFTEN